MTDEEMADKYIKKNNLEWELECNRTSPIGEVKQAFLAGLEAGKEIEKEYVKNNAFTSMKEQGLFPFGKWHKVADGDLPKDENDVLVYSGEDWRMCVGRYSPKYKAWETGCDTIAWCEIPKYTEE